MNIKKILHIVAVVSTVTTATSIVDTTTGGINIIREEQMPMVSRMVRGEVITGRSFLDETNRLIEEQKEQERVRIEEEKQRALELQRIKEEEERLAAEQERLAREEAERIASLKPNLNLYDLTEPSNVDFNKAYAMLEGSALQTAAGAYVYAEQVYGVNAIFLMALTSLESGHGRSELAMYRNNLGGVKGSNGDWAYFSDWGECIMHIAEFLSELYLTEGGIYHNGYSIWAVNIKYCQDDSDWAGMISSIANTLMSKVNY